MKETYENIEIDIENITDEDVITTSAQHENAYVDSGELFGGPF